MGFHLDTTGNVWLGSGSEGDTLSDAISAGPPNFYVTSLGSIYAAAGTIGGIDLAATYIQSSNYSNTPGSEAGFKINSNGNAEFNAVTVRGTLDGPSLTGNLTGNTSSSIQVGGSSQDFVKLYYDSTFGGSIKFDEGGVDRFFIDYDGASKFYLRTGLNTDLALSAQGGDIFMYADTIHLQDNPLGSDAPILKLWNGSSFVAGNNQVLGADSSGNLEWTTVASSPVTSISGSGEITVTESSGAYTIEHADSDHNGSFVAVSDYLNHVGNSSAHGTFDNYSYWRLREDGNNVGTVSSTQSVNFIGGSNVTVSNSGSGGDHNITISASTSGISGAQMGSNGTGFLSAIVSGSVLTFNTTNTDNSTIHVGSLDPSYSSSDIGNSSSDRFADIYAANHHGGIFYGTLINSSSQNVKENVAENTLGLDFINSMVTKEFNYITRDHSDLKYTGMIAEDLKTVLSDNSWDGYYFVEEIGKDKYQYFDRCSHVVKCECDNTDCCPEKMDFDYYCENDCCSDYFKHTNDRGETRNYLHHTVEECEEYEVDGNRHPHINYYQFVAPLVKAVQELSTQISDLTARVEALEG